MKKLIAFLLPLCILSFQPLKAQDPVKKWGQLQVKGAQLCDAQERWRMDNDPETG